MNARSLHVRLAIWHAGWLGIVFLASGALVYFGLRQYLGNHAAMQELQRAERAAAVVQRVGVADPRRLADEITTRFAPEATGRFLRLSAPGGAVIYRSGPPHDLGFDPGRMPPPSAQRGPRRFRIENGDEWVWAGIPVAVGGESYWVEVGESMEPGYAGLRGLLVSLAAGFGAVAVVAVLGGILLVRRALAPVEAIALSAEQITSRNLSERLPVPPTGDEFEHLSRTLNGMIARLDEAFLHNRRFLADASHELRTPLTVLRGELENLAQEPRLAPEFRERLGSTLEEVERLAEIVRGLFDLARLDAGEALVVRSSFDLSRLVASTADQMLLLAEDKGVSVSWGPRGAVWVDGDRSRLKQVVVNLLDNAIKYTPRGGSVAILSGVRGDRAFLEVVDTGIGIPAAALPHVFDRFFRVDTARGRDLGGAGLGLAIVKSICTAHGGSVEVRSDGKTGSCFRVELPSCPAPSREDSDESDRL